jgi:hypothetical protein
MLTRVAVFSILFALPVVVEAHRDMWIPIENDGALGRLPPQYQPAKLEIRFDRGEGEKGVSFVRLTIAKRDVTLPICVSYILRSESLSEIRAKGSWYHENGSLPPYLELEFFDPGYNADSWPNGGYSLLFNLNTAQLIRMDVNIVREKGKSVQAVPVDIRQLCSAKEAAKLGR